MQIFSEIEKHSLIEYLLFHPEIADTGVWARFKVGMDFFVSRDEGIKKKTIWIVANIISNCDFSLVARFLELLSAEGANILDQVKSILSSETDDLLLENTLSILSMILLYGNEHPVNGKNMIR